MKKQFNTLIFASLLFLISCYSDKGNYNYDPVKMDITGFYSAYSVLKGKELAIYPSVFPEDGEYEYVWGIYKQLLVEQSVPELDTISTSRDLKWVCDVAPGNYPMVFTARNIKTGVSKTMYAPLSIITENTTGWYVLKDFEGDTDFDMYYEGATIKNWIATYNDGKKLKGEAVSICFCNSYEIEKGKYTNAMMPISTQEMAIMDVNTGSVIKNIDQLFYEKPAVLNFQNSCGENLKWLVINNGRLHKMDVQDGKFGLPMIGNYRLSPQRVYFSGGQSTMFFDEISNSFIAQDGTTLSLFPDDQFGNPGLISPSNMKADLRFLRRFSIGNYDTYALMKIQNKEQAMIFNMALSPTFNPIMQIDTIPDKNGKGQLVWKGDKYAVNLNNLLIYFVYDNKIYSFNMKTHEEREELKINANEEVTYMENIVYSDLDKPSASINNFIIATKSGNTYKVYRHTISAGRLSETPLEPIFTGDGKVAKVIYVGIWGSSALI